MTYRLDEEIQKVLNEKFIDYGKIEDEAKVRAGKCFLDYYINNTKDLDDDYNDFGKIWQRENASQLLYDSFHLDNKTIDKILDQYTYWTKEDWIPNEILNQFAEYVADYLEIVPGSLEEKIINMYEQGEIKPDSLMDKFIDIGYKFIKVV